MTTFKSSSASLFKTQIFHLVLALLFAFVTSARILDELVPAVPEPDAPVSDVAPAIAVAPGSGAAGAATVPGGAAGAATATGGGGAGAAAAPVVAAAAAAAPVGAAGAATAPGGSAASGAAVQGVGAATADVADGDHPELTFFLHDILGGSNPSAKAITGIVTNPAVSGQVPFAKPNGAVLPTNNGVPQNNDNNGLINNNNIPFLTGLGGMNPNVMQNNGNNNNFIGGYGFPVVNGAQLSAGTTLQKLMFGTMMAIDDQLTEGHDLGSGLLGKAQGFYIYSSEDGKSQTMAFTAMFQEGGYVDSLNFFGVHQTAVSESWVAVMGGTGKYVNAKGYALVKTLPPVDQHETDGIETVLEFSVYLRY